MTRTPSTDTAPTSDTATEETHSVNHVRLMPPGLPSERLVTTGLEGFAKVGCATALPDNSPVQRIAVTAVPQQ